MIWGRVWGWRLCQSQREGGFLTVLEPGGQGSHWTGAILGLKDSAWPSEHRKAPHLGDVREQNDCRRGTEKDELQKRHRDMAIAFQFLSGSFKLILCLLMA